MRATVSVFVPQPETSGTKARIVRCTRRKHQERAVELSARVSGKRICEVWFLHDAPRLALSSLLLHPSSVTCLLGESPYLRTLFAYKYLNSRRFYLLFWGGGALLYVYFRAPEGVVYFFKLEVWENVNTI